MSNIISFFQKLIKGGGVGIRAGGGGWKIFQKLISGGGDDYSVLESTYEGLIKTKPPVGKRIKYCSKEVPECSHH